MLFFPKAPAAKRQQPLAFTEQPRYRNGLTNRFGGHIFERVCQTHGIQHELTKPYHPWTNGQAERMNRTVEEATIKSFHSPDFDVLKAHVLAFVTAYNFAKHLKALRWRTSFKTICDAWARTPNCFKLDPHHPIPGLHTLMAESRVSEGIATECSASGFRRPLSCSKFGEVLLLHADAGADFKHAMPRGGVSLPCNKKPPRPGGRVRRL